MTRNICLFTSPYSFAQPAADGIISAAQRVGPWRIECNPLNPENLRDFVDSHSFDGFIAVFQQSYLVAKIAAAGKPMVSVIRPVAAVASVCHDDAAIGSLGLEHLAECGYQRCAFYGTNYGAQPPFISADRFRGFCEAAKRHRISVSSNADDAGNWPLAARAATDDAVLKWLESLSLPTAVMACNDHLASLIARVAVDKGLRVPGDVAILGVDDDRLLCETGPVPISSIDPDVPRVGFTAGLLVDRLMRHEAAQDELVILPPKGVVCRQSTSIYAHPDRDVAAAVRFVHQHACEQITVDDIARHVLLSRRSLEQRFRNVVGRSPGDEIRRLRMERAKALLAETTMNLPEVAMRCGYSYDSSFAAAFRQIVGVSPNKYRQQSSGASRA